MEYERFGQVESNRDWRIRYNAPVTDRFDVTIGGGALDNLQIQTLQPQPLEAVTIGSDLSSSPCCTRPRMPFTSSLRHAALILPLPL